jgi:pimeloyl-ACP methyl ester carboxylesterase
MYMECHGKGSPTVVLVSGFRGAHDDWTHVVGSGGEPKPSGSAVFPKVGKFTRVCAYDLPGTTTFDGTLSPSTPVPQPTTAQDGAADLHALLRAAKQKAADYQPSVDALRRAAPPVGEIPAVVLTADKCWLTFPGEDAAEAEATCQAWLAAQNQLAAVLNAKHITDTDSGHFIQGDQPKLVIHSVRKVVGAARKNACALGSNHGQCIKAEKHARP